MPGQTVDYETMWRYTLVNYNAGAGCLATAINQAYAPGAVDPLGWDRVAPVLERNCPGSVAYVGDVSKIVEAPPPDVPAESTNVP
jgi:hypothetical protein